MGCCGSKRNGGDDKWATSRKGRRPGLSELRKMNQVSPDELGSQRAEFGDDASKNAQLRSGVSCLQIMEKNSVLVAVRVRPLNEREKSAGSKECIVQDGIANLKLQRGGSEKDCNFAFDCVMRSGVSQRDLFDRTGRPLLHKVLEGYNGCLFAYGQTGSGKTYTMQGAGAAEHQGLIPLLCAELFSQIDERSLSKTITVQCSVLEIYNEKLKDLLAQSGDDLQIREAGRGTFIEGASEVDVRSVEEVQALISKGQARRAVGQTSMNEHSSRSHAIVTLQIACRDAQDSDGVTTTTSKLHLIDLAGSERQKATGATGDRLKEGAQINLSLSALGNVINALTDGKAGKSRHVPYRDSKITRLLQDSLGGNSYTVMVCNISPAQMSAEETLSCLRFAERAKKIENKAVVNQDPKNAKIAELLLENKALRATVSRLEIHVSRLEDNY